MEVTIITRDNQRIPAHAPRSQFTDLLIKADILEVAPQSPDDPIEACRKGTLVEAARWYTHKVMQPSGFMKPMLVHTDGRGGTEKFRGIPPKLKRYVPPTPDEIDRGLDGHYEWVSPIETCPKQVLDEFVRLLADTDPEIAQIRGQAKRDAIARQEYEQKQQEYKAQIVLNTYAVK